MMVSPSEGAVIAIVHRNDETGQDFKELDAILKANIKKYKKMGKSERWIQGYIRGWGYVRGQRT